jgi:hypothetical protein
VDKHQRPIHRWATLPSGGPGFEGLGVPAGAARVLRLRHTGRLADPPEQRRAWKEHGRTDHYLALAEVRAACARVLPGATVRRHLLWRYSVVWRRPR